jgi:hypothetical protein
VDEIAGRTADMGERLHAMVTTGITAAVEEPELVRALFASAYGEQAQQRIRQSFVDRTAAFFAGSSVDAASKLDPRLISVLWQGSITAVLRADAGVGQPATVDADAALPVRTITAEVLPRLPSRAAPTVGARALATGVRCPPAVGASTLGRST